MIPLSIPRLGINVDHVATLRNARGGTHPCPVHAAQLAIKAGADSITAHLREDRRHIRDEDIYRLNAEINAPLNLEMAATEEMLTIARDIKPHAVCLVPERREELTTEGGLDVAGNLDYLTYFCHQLSEAGIRVSLFVDPTSHQLEAAKKTGAPVVELHTGTYCHHHGEQQATELKRILIAADYTQQLNLECHAGHGLTYSNVVPIAAHPAIKELNIGHFLMGEALFLGLENSIKTMLTCLRQSRLD